MQSLVVVALGSNLGDRLGAFRIACARLERSGVRIVRRSRLYWSRPMGGAGQPWFLNAAVAVRTDLRPMELLGRCQGVERAMGRRRKERWEPRIIDLDLIFFGSVRSESERLVLPHPDWSRRDFVLGPVADLNLPLPIHAMKSIGGNPGAAAAGLERYVESIAPWP